MSKEQEIRRIIREEVKTVLLERMGSRKLAAIVNSFAKYEKTALVKAMTASKIDLNGIIDDDIILTRLSPKQIYGKKGLYLVIAEKDFDTREGGTYGWNRSIKRGQLVSMFFGGKVAYITKNGLGSKSRYGSTGGKVGLDIKGKNSAISMSTLPVVVYRVAYEDLVSPMKAKQQMRADMKFGAIAFKTSNQFKQENLRRYKDALEKSADKSEKLHKLVLACVKHSNDLVNSSLNNQVKDNYGEFGVEVDGRIYSLQAVTNLQNKILNNYGKYTDYDTRAAGEDEQWHKDYYVKERASYALELKKNCSQMLKNRFDKW